MFTTRVTRPLQITWAFSHSVTNSCCCFKCKFLFQSISKKFWKIRLASQIRWFIGSKRPYLCMKIDQNIDCVKSACGFAFPLPPKNAERNIRKYFLQHFVFSSILIRWSTGNCVHLWSCGLGFDFWAVDLAFTPFLFEAQHRDSVENKPASLFVVFKAS